MTVEKFSEIIWTVFRIIEIILKFGEMVEAIDDGTYEPATATDEKSENN